MLEAYVDLVYVLLRNQYNQHLIPHLSKSTSSNALQILRELLLYISHNTCHRPTKGKKSKGLKNQEERLQQDIIDHSAGVILDFLLIPRPTDNNNEYEMNTESEEEKRQKQQHKIKSSLQVWSVLVGWMDPELALTKERCGGLLEYYEMVKGKEEVLEWMIAAVSRASKPEAKVWMLVQFDLIDKITREVGQEEEYVMDEERLIKRVKGIGSLGLQLMKLLGDNDIKVEAKASPEAVKKPLKKKAAPKKKKQAKGKKKATVEDAEAMDEEDDQVMDEEETAEALISISQSQIRQSIIKLLEAALNFLNFTIINTLPYFSVFFAQFVRNKSNFVSVTQFRPVREGALMAVFNGVLKKMLLPLDRAMNEEDQNVRKEGRRVIKALAEKDRSFFNERIIAYVEKAIETIAKPNSSQQDWQETELAVDLVFHYSDLEEVMTTGFSSYLKMDHKRTLYKTIKSPSVAFQDGEISVLAFLIGRIMKPAILRSPHNCIKLSLLHSAVKYQDYFQLAPALLFEVLETFVDCW